MPANQVPCADEFDTFCTQNNHLDKTDQHRQFSRRLFSREQFSAAVFYADKVISLIDPGEVQVITDDYRHAEACAYAAGNIPHSLSLVKKLIHLSPDNHKFLTRAGMYYMLQGDNKVAEEYYLKARDIKPDDSNVCDALAHLYGLLEHSDKMKSYGNKALKLKDAEAITEENLNKVYRIIGAKYRGFHSQVQQLV